MRRKALEFYRASATCEVDVGRGLDTNWGTTSGTSILQSARYIHTYIPDCDTTYNVLHALARAVISTLCYGHSLPCNRLALLWVRPRTDLLFAQPLIMGTHRHTQYRQSPKHPVTRSLPITTQVTDLLAGSDSAIGCPYSLSLSQECKKDTTGASSETVSPAKMYYRSSYSPSEVLPCVSSGGEDAHARRTLPPVPSATTTTCARYECGAAALPCP